MGKCPGEDVLNGVHGGSESCLRDWFGDLLGNGLYNNEWGNYSNVWCNTDMLMGSLGQLVTLCTVS